MKVIVGLGNPGVEYVLTKHNIGFSVVKSLAKDKRIKINQKLRFSVFGKGRIGRETVILALPQTYMNLSGKAVGELLHQRPHDITDLVVICDDINLELGRIRIRKQGSAGGHKGLESIIHTIGKDDFIRVRIGIATDVHKGDITKYVLSPFKRKEARHASHVITLAEDALVSMMEKGVDEAMNKFNKRKLGTS